MYLIISHNWSDLLFHEEPVDGLLFPDELDNQSVQVDKQSSAETTGDTAETQTRQKGESWRHLSTWHKNAIWMITLKLE